MPDLTVSSAVDTLMQATDVAGIQAAVGLDAIDDAQVLGWSDIVMAREAAGQLSIESQIAVVPAGGAAPHASAALDIQSTTLGFGAPAMTEVQRDAIASPRAGLVIYNTTTGKLNVRGASAWEAITSA